jgi:hypothetical protein
MKTVTIFTLLIMLFSNCDQQEVGCRRVSILRVGSHPFVFLDKVTGENLVVDHPPENEKQIPLDSLALFNTSGDTLPPRQWRVEKYADVGYAAFVQISDVTKTSSNSGSSTYVIYSGKGDYDTIRYDYNYGPSTYCVSDPPPTDIFHIFINGKPAESSFLPTRPRAFIISK